MTLWILVVILMALSDHVDERELKRQSEQILEHSYGLTPLRLAFHIVDGAFTEANRDYLIDKVIPAVTEFYSSALKLSPLVKPLKPSVDTCNSVQVPEVHRKEGLAVDTIIYIHSEVSFEQQYYGKSCEQEAGKYKRPIVGSLGIHPAHFFNIAPGMRIMYFIREVAHVLAFDKELFKDFVYHDGSTYSDTQYSLEINYPKRGKTVKTIAFPEMLDKARSAFNCNIEGLELEDYYEEVNENQASTFWDSRIMTHDILSSHINAQSVFSDISLAVFSDSGWYYPDFSYSQKISWGWKAGCKWMEEKCISDGKVNLQGFCSEETEYDQCDAFSLGYGLCLIDKSLNIPPHEQYFSDSTLGGLGVADYCPLIYKSPTNFCRAATFKNKTIGETKGFASRCFTSSLQLKNDNTDQLTSQSAGCYSVEMCSEVSVSVKVGSQVVSCPYGQKVSVSGFVGQLVCPENKSFCENVPCPNLCNGRGKCVNGKCVCKEGWSGNECAEPCIENCKYCPNPTVCQACSDGYFLSGKSCFKCDDNCKTCMITATTCTSCSNGAQIKNGICNKKCRPYCSSCDEPCTKCDSGYFLKDGYCSVCSEGCLECSTSSDSCTACKPGLKLRDSVCLPDCIAGCSNCDYPCTACKSGYLLSSNICLDCDNICQTCSIKTSNCTSCFEGYSLIGSTCKQGCKPNCLSCDDPCTRCEDGYYLNSESCKPCSSKCLTCIMNSEICTSCRVGFELKGASCEISCVENCSSCKFPCESCKEGFFIEDGLCSQCTHPCKTCTEDSNNCLSCQLGFGLINNECNYGCSDHCLNCASPCNICELGYYLKNGACLKCDESCEYCESSGNDKCIGCALGYLKKNGVCVKDCQDNCESCDEPCSKCRSGFYQFLNGCQECSSTCKTCSSHLTCDSCVDGFGLGDGSCKILCLDHCLSCDSPCSECERGYYTKNGLCIECDDPCSACIHSPTSCSECKEGYILSGSQCTLGCVENCKTCDHPCQACQIGFTVSNGLCYSCPEGCETCSSDFSKCFSCHLGYTYQNNKCVKSCGSKCKSCDDPCTLCESGYLAIDGVCMPCSHPCSSCINYLDYCTSCIKGYGIDDYKCVPRCLENCLTCDDPCTSCLDGFMLFNQVCEPCSLDCRTCNGAPDMCTSCKAWKKLVNGKCVENCIENCVDCSYPCRACKDTYELFEGSCMMCKNYLSEEDVDIRFIHDFTGISLSFLKPMPTKISKCSYYFKTDTLAMIGLGALCSWNEINQLIVIFGENADFNIRTISLNSLVAHGSNCSSVSKDLTVKVSMEFLSKPFVSISSPMKFSLGCKNEVLTIQGITEEKNYKFEFKTNPVKSDLENYLNEKQGKILIIPESILEKTVINATFTATNRLGISDHVTHLIEITNEKTLSVYIDVGSKLKISSSQEYSVQGIVQQTDCFSHDSLEYSWHYVEIKGSVSKSATDLVKNSKSHSILNIKPGSLPAGRRYLFKFHVTNNKVLATSDIEITVVESPLVAIIDRSTSSTPFTEPLVLSAAYSYAPEDVDAVLNFDWDCISYDSDCVDLNNQTLLTTNHDPVLEISGYRMKKDTEYLFSVKVTKDKRVSKDFVLITPLDSAGHIKIRSNVGTVNPARDYYVYPEFFISSAECKMKWTQLGGPAVKPKSMLNKPYLIIGGNEMLEGRRYSFRLNASCENKTMFADSTFYTNTGPDCSELNPVVSGDTVNLLTRCSDGDFNDFPLYYIYGVYKDQHYIPLKVVHSPSTTLNLIPGNWTVYAEVCDSLHTCKKLQKSVHIPGRALEASAHLYKTQKNYPGSVPLAILNSASTFNQDNFKEAFDDLKAYIKSMNLDLVHFKMAIECLEILTYSNKTHFFHNYQGDIVKFLSYIGENVKRIDDEAMKYIVDLFSEHRITEHALISKMFSEFSEKWSYNMPPGSFKTIGSKVELVRHRFTGKDSSKTYNFESESVAEVNLEGDPSKIYDLLLVSYPGKSSSIVNIMHYVVGIYHDYTIEFFDSDKEISLDLNSPFYIEFKLDTPGNYKCQQLRGEMWIDEGCTITNQSDTYLTVVTWHVSAYRLVKTQNTERGYSALIAEGIMLFICLSSVIILCIVDKEKNNYIQAAFVPDTPDSPRNSDKDVNEIDITKRGSVQSPGSVLRSGTGLENYRTVQYPTILYHPWLSIVFRQNGERRAFSVLHLFAVLFTEFLATGLLFNNKIHSVFDENDGFVGFSKAQVIFFVSGLTLAQMLSGLLTNLNQINDFTITKKYSGMGLTAILITFTAGVSLLFAFTYPAKYSFAWTIVFLIVALVDLVVFASIHWLINYKFMKANMDETSISRNMRVFTTET